MSPVHAMERSYRAIKQLLRDGQIASGARLEANTFAQDLNVSVTPVRDVLHRLAGEKLVEATSGEGFRVPRYSEADLRSLYGWNAALMILSARAVDIGPALLASRRPCPLADRFGTIVEHVAALVPNQEVAAALRNASDRLQPFRIAECYVFEDLSAELEAFETSTSNFANTIRTLHARRIRSVSELLQHRDRM